MSPPTGLSGRCSWSTAPDQEPSWLSVNRADLVGNSSRSKLRLSGTGSISGIFWSCSRDWKLGWEERVRRERERHRQRHRETERERELKGWRSGFCNLFVSNNVTVLQPILNSLERDSTCFIKQLPSWIMDHGSKIVNIHLIVISWHKTRRSSAPLIIPWIWNR